MTIDTESLITAMCLWEAVLESKEEPQIKAAFENLGTVGMRFYVAQWVEPANKAWEALSEEEKESSIPFDWEFVPDWIAKHVDLSHAHQPIIV